MPSHPERVRRNYEGEAVSIMELWRRAEHHYILRRAAQFVESGGTVCVPLPARFRRTEHCPCGITFQPQPQIPGDPEWTAEMPAKHALTCEAAKRMRANGQRTGDETV